MNKTRTKELKTILGMAEFSAATKSAAKKILRHMGMRELLEVERDMIEEGDDVFEAKKEVPRSVGFSIDNLPAGHPVRRMIAEHGELLLTLDDMYEVNNAISRQGVTKESILELKKIAEKLRESERYQRREEKALFPELEKRGIGGTTEIMRAEHIGFCQHRRELSYLLKNPKEHSNFRSEIDRITKYLNYHMKEHIFKENKLLYPEALGAITDGRVWEKINERAKRYAQK